MSVSFVLEALVVLGAIVMGTRAGGVGVGLWGGLGTFVLVFVFREPPGEPPGSGPRDHPRRRHLGRDDAGRGRDRLDGLRRGRCHREAPQADHPHRTPDGLPLLDRRRDEQHHLPAAAGHLRRLVQEPHPPRAAAHGDRRPVGHGPGRLARLGGHGGDADAHGGRALQPRADADPRDHHPVVRHRHRRHLARGQPDVEEPRRRPRGAGQDRLGRARRTPARRSRASPPPRG